MENLQGLGGSKNGSVRDISATRNGAIPISTLIGLVGLSGVVVRLPQRHFKRGEIRL